MKDIRTLIPDVQELLTRKDGWFTNQIAAEFSKEVSSRLQSRFNPGAERHRKTLRISKLGNVCPCALWYSVRHPELAEEMPPWAENKFCFGDIIEAWAITLAKGAGHTVEGEQDAVTVDGIEGHRDCVIDGCIVDVKSASSRSFIKFKDGSIASSDTFGYLSQLDGYLVGSLQDPIVTTKDKAYLWAIDKTLGHMCLHEHSIREADIRNRIRQYKEIVARLEPPSCECETKDVGKSGNVGLGVRASYSPFKHCCFPNLRTFLYAEGPVYLTRVERKPDVPEINSSGQIVYY